MYVITQPYPNFKIGISKTPFKFGHGVVIASLPFEVGYYVDRSSLEVRSINLKGRLFHR